MYFTYLYNILFLHYEAIYHGHGYVEYIVVDDTVMVKYETPTQVYQCFWKQEALPSSYFTFDVEDLIENPVQSIQKFGEKTEENGVLEFACWKKHQEPNIVKLQQMNGEQDGLTVKHLNLQFKRDRSPSGIISFDKEVMVSCFCFIQAILPACYS